VCCTVLNVTSYRADIPVHNGACHYGLELIIAAKALCGGHPQRGTPPQPPGI
jgi:hypothetical protein